MRCEASTVLRVRARRNAAVVLGLLLTLIALSRPEARAPDDHQACACPDVFDLTIRHAEAEAAIAAFQGAINGWAANGGAPAASEAGRTALKNQVQGAINGVTDSRANHPTGVTDAACQVTNLAATACMKEVVAQHEHMHAEACANFVSAHPLSIDRWPTLEDYAREEISGYQSELSYINGSLSNLRRECRFTLDVQSTIRGGQVVAESKTSAQVPLEAGPNGFAPHGVVGSAALDYDTRDVGPPKMVGDPMLMKLMVNCYATAVGKGTLPVNVTDGLLMRQKVPPYAPIIDFTIDLGTSQETFSTKGPSKCPKSAPTQGSFWSDMFRASKTQITQTAIEINDWDYQPRPGVFAEKTILSNCSPPGSPAVMMLGYRVTLCSEKTVLTIKSR
jgi:hypothetical protein